MTVIALKLLLAPGFIVATSLVARRFGVRVAGVVGGLPVIAAAILLVLAIDRGRAFAGDAAKGAVLAVVALIGFVFVYERASRRFSWPVALPAAWAAFLAATAVLRFLHVSALVAVVLATGACGAMLAALPRRRAVPVPSRPHPPWDLPLRAASALALVLAVTTASATLGPRLSGLLAGFPIITALLSAFTHAQRGAEEATRLLQGFTLAFVSYALFCFIVSVGIRDLGVGGAFGLATAVTLAAQTAALAATRRR